MGRVFLATRRVVAFQHGKENFIMSASFQIVLKKAGASDRHGYGYCSGPETLPGES